MDIVARCRTLSAYHGGTDLAERVRSALDLQREQRLALAQAADHINDLEVDRDKLKARIHRLELALADDGELPAELRD